MALTYTPTGELGSKLPQFTLPDVNGNSHSSDQIQGAKAKLVLFICAHCPYVQAIEERLVALGHKLGEIKVPMLAICSNDSTDYPEDRPEALKQRAEEYKYSFPYLLDESQEVAKSFGAVCTPDFFVYDNANTLVYRGRLDDSWKDPGQVTQEELLEAVEAILNDKDIPDQHPSLGCSIKWK